MNEQMDRESVPVTYLAGDGWQLIAGLVNEALTHDESCRDACVTMGVRLSPKKKQMRDEIEQKENASWRFHRLTGFFIFSGCIYMNYHIFENSGMVSDHRAYETEGVWHCHPSSKTVILFCLASRFTTECEYLKINAV